MKKAEVGITFLLLLIAAILIVMVAATVMLQTATSLQNQALESGSNVREETSTQIQVIEMWAEDASESGGTQGNVNISFLRVKLHPGSQTLKIPEILLSTFTENTRESYIYNSSNNCSNLSDIYASNTTFGGRYIKGGDADGYLQQLDVFEICFQLPEVLNEDDTLHVHLHPKNGQSTKILMVMPDRMVTQRVPLYPFS